jgi:hypothetical protein
MMEILIDMKISLNNDEMDGLKEIKLYFSLQHEKLFEVQ